ncbi:MAG TPA: DUF4162 domain-containing protein, partial [Anaerolineae bacterium]|nr:DUF4162 domain-containing protein [Anaerolineae bacterium]
LLIVDEPFAALDPINTRTVKELMCELRDEGVTIVMSTHQMHQVEELCDRIVLIDHGRNVLYGSLDQVRRQYAGSQVRVRVDGSLPALVGVEQTVSRSGTIELQLAAGTTPQQILEQLIQCHAAVEHFELAVPTLEEVFVRAVAEHAERNAR